MDHYVRFSYSFRPIGESATFFVRHNVQKKSQHRSICTGSHRSTCIGFVNRSRCSIDLVCTRISQHRSTCTGSHRSTCTGSHRSTCIGFVNRSRCSIDLVCTKNHSPAHAYARTCSHARTHTHAHGHMHAHSCIYANTPVGSIRFASWSGCLMSWTGEPDKSWSPSKNSNTTSRMQLVPFL